MDDYKKSVRLEFKGKDLPCDWSWEGLVICSEMPGRVRGNGVCVLMPPETPTHSTALISLLLQC